MKVADTLSDPRPVNGGAPQGSCAGVQMYSVGTDDIEEGALARERVDPDWSFIRHHAGGRPVSSSSDEYSPIADTNTAGPSSHSDESRHSRASVSSASTQGTDDPLTNL